MKKEDVIVLAQNNNKTLRNTLLYLTKRKEFVVVSHFEINDEKNEVSWDWGHYFDKLEEAWRCYYEVY